MFKGIITCLTFFLLSSCSGAILAPTLVGAYMIGSFTSVSEMTNEYILQKKIYSGIRKFSKSHDVSLFNIEILVYNKAIYIIGLADNNSIKKKLLDFISYEYKKTYKMIDEVRITNLQSYFAWWDYIIKNKIKMKLIFKNGVRYGNYYITVYKGEAIIIGAAANKYEAQLVLERITSTRGVKKIINYVEVKDIGD